MGTKGHVIVVVCTVIAFWVMLVHLHSVSLLRCTHNDTLIIICL